MESPSIEVFRHICKFIIFLLVAMLIGQTVDFVFKQCKEKYFFTEQQFPRS
jgi:hypothetical protein